MGLVSRLATFICLSVVGAYFIPGSPLPNFLAAELATAALKFAYLFSIAFSIGVADWQSFVFGLVAFKTLPRQSFGLLQSKLFPIYFQALVLGNSTALFAFSSLRTGEEAAKEKYQIYVLIVALSSWVSNLIIFEPLTSSAMMARHKYEREQKSTEDQDIKDTPKYK